MSEPSTPRLALARDLIRCAVLEVDTIRRDLMALAVRVFAMDDPIFEDEFLDVVDQREALFKKRDARRVVFEAQP